MLDRLKHQKTHCSTPLGIGKDLMALQISNILWGLFKSSQGLISFTHITKHPLRQLGTWKTDLIQDSSQGLLCKSAIMQSDGKSHYPQNVWKLNGVCSSSEPQPVIRYGFLHFFFVFCFFQLGFYDGWNNTLWKWIRIPTSWFTPWTTLSIFLNLCKP